MLNTIAAYLNPAPPSTSPPLSHPGHGPPTPAQVPPFQISRLTLRNVKLMRPSVLEFIAASPTAFRDLAQRTLGMVQQGTLKARACGVCGCARVRLGAQQ